MKTSTMTKTTSTTKIAVATIFLLAAGAAAFIIAPPLKLKSLQVPPLKLSILNIAKAPDSPSGASSPGSVQVVAKFILSASNNKNITLKEITFNYTAPKFAISTWRLYDASSGAQLGALGTVTDKNRVKFSNLIGVVIPAGQSKTVALRADTDLATMGASLQVSMPNEPNQIVSDAQIINGLPINFGTFLY